MKTHFVHAEALVELISSRWRPGNGEETGAPVGCLRRIHVRFPEMRNILELDPVRSFVEEGLVVQMF